MIHAAVAVEDGHALLLGPFTVTAVHAVIWPVVPLAGKDEQTLWKKKKTQHTSLLYNQTWYLMELQC